MTRPNIEELDRLWEEAQDGEWVPTREKDAFSVALHNAYPELSAYVKRLEERDAALVRQLKQATANNERRNRQLDALQFVWCNGGCAGGVNRFTGAVLTEEMVIEAERNTRRLRTWWSNHALKEKYKVEREAECEKPKASIWNWWRR